MDVVSESFRLLFVSVVDCVRDVKVVAMVISSSDKGIYVESVAVDDSLDGCETRNIVKNCVEDDRKWDSWKARMFLASSTDQRSFEYCRRS
jgi:hypothetical protein